MRRSPSRNPTDHCSCELKSTRAARGDGLSFSARVSHHRHDSLCALLPWHVRPSLSEKETRHASDAVEGTHWPCGGPTRCGGLRYEFTEPGKRTRGMLGGQALLLRHAGAS